VILKRSTVLKLALIPIAAIFFSCSSADPPTAPPQRSFLFAVRGIPDAEGRFVASTTSPQVLAIVENQLALSEEQRMLHISGPVAPGNGGHNLGWSWHFEPGSWELVEISIELCDGRPQMVEDDVDKWIADVGVFCPWGSYVLREL
jgi:hypothetical protein